MDPDAIAVLIAMFVGTGIIYSLKLMLFGKGPVFGGGAFGNRELARRMADLEDKNEAMLAELGEYDDQRIAEIEERLDFAERMLGRQQFHNLELGEVRAPTPT